MRFLRAMIELVACALVLAGAWYGVQRILATEPEAQREGATRRSAMLVELTNARAGTFEPEIVVLGQVRPSREVRLSTLVAGRVESRAPAFAPGRFVDSGELLVGIEDADYRNVVHQRETALGQAEAGLQMEQGRQKVARRDFEMLEPEVEARLDAAQKRLALREPQIEAARLQVAAARTALQQAQLDQQRTEVRAPFAALVITRNAELGSRVSPGDDLGHLVGVDSYWVVASVPLRRLRWIRFDGDDEEGSRVRVRDRAAWPDDRYREGRVLRLVGRLDKTTRLAQVLIEIPDPLGREAADGSGLPLILDAIVEVRIASRPVADVHRIDRSVLRRGDTVWAMEADGTLGIRPVDVVFRNERYAYVGSGIDAETRIVTTNLAAVVPGAPLRTESADTPIPAPAGDVPE